MEKTRSHTKKKVKKDRSIEVEFDKETLDLLNATVALTGLSLNQVLSVLLALYIVENRKEKYHNKQAVFGIGLGEK